MISDLQNSPFELTTFAGVNTGVWNNFKILSGSIVKEEALRLNNKDNLVPWQLHST